MKRKNRLSIYKYLLDKYLKNEEYSFSLCHNLFFFFGNKIVIRNFPELVKQKPKDKRMNLDYWWEEKQCQPRINALTNAINDIHSRLTLWMWIKLIYYRLKTPYKL